MVMREKSTKERPEVDWKEKKEEGFSIGQRTKKTILYVEDDEYLADRLIRAIESSKKGIEIVKASNLEEAARTLFEIGGIISLILTDISYPRREGEFETPDSGIALIRYAKGATTVPIIAYSSSDSYLSEAKQAGADIIISKHKGVSVIKGVIESVLGVSTESEAKNEKKEGLLEKISKFFKRIKEWLEDRFEE